MVLLSLFQTDFFSPKNEVQQKVYQAAENILKVRYQVEPLKEETKQLFFSSKNKNSPLFILWQEAANECIRRGIIKSKHELYYQLHRFFCRTRKVKGRTVIISYREYVIEHFVRFFVPLIPSLN